MNPADQNIVRQIVRWEVARILKEMRALLPNPDIDRRPVGTKGMLAILDAGIKAAEEKWS